MSQKKQKEIDLESLTPEEKVKYEIAEELGLLDRVLKDGWKSLSAKETGRIGGIMTRKKREKIKNDKITAFHVRFPGCGDFFLGQEMFDKIVFS